MRKNKNIFILMLSEIRSKITWKSLIAIVIMISISLLPTLLQDPINTHMQDPKIIIKLSEIMFSSSVFQAVFYNLLFRLWNVLKDNSTIEKNRVTYLNYYKGNVLFAKIFADILLFSLFFAILIPVEYLIIIYKNNGIITNHFLAQVIVFFVGCMFMYLLTSFGMRLIQSNIFNSFYKNISYFIWISITVGMFVIMSIVCSSLPTTVGNWVKNNSTILSFIPFLNIMIIAGIFSGNIDMWKILPLIFETSIIIISFWKITTISTKRFLCT